MMCIKSVVMDWSGVFWYQLVGCPSNKLFEYQSLKKLAEEMVLFVLSAMHFLLDDIIQEMDIINVNSVEMSQDLYFCIVII
jgi:hypothetical protein